jgi:hypothetical protein
MFKYIRILSIFLLLSLISVFIYKYHRQIPTHQNIVENIIPTPTLIEKNALPNIHLIKTAFIPQAPEKNWNEPWQDACEEAALLTVHYYYQKQNPDANTIINNLKNLFNFESNQAWTSDINTLQMATLSAKLWGYHSVIIDNPTVDDFKNYLSQDIPVIIPANGKILFTENSHFKGGGPWYHNLVVLGYDDTKNQFTVHDVGTQFGAYFHYSYTTLINSIHDFPTSLKKEDINSGTPRALVLLK